MAQKVQLNREAFSCAICLDLLKDPVALSCGHSYCMKCVQSHWDKEDGKSFYSCPQCRQSFLQRPTLVKNTMLAFLVEELKKSELLEAEGCLCTEHNKEKEMFCRTEELCICPLCCMEKHKGHDITSALTERSKRQRELENTRLKILHKIQLKEKDVELLQKEALSIGRSAQEAVRLSGDSFTELMHLLEKRRTEVEREIRSEQKTQEAQVQELQDQVQRDITELRRTLTQMDSLALTPDHNHFLLHCPALLKDTEAPASAPIQTSHEPCFKKMIEAVTALTVGIEQILKQDMDHISLALSRVQLLLHENEPKTREEFLKYSKEITLDPNTVSTNLLLSDGNKRLTCVSNDYNYPNHPDRFDGRRQALSREVLTGCCYWEVEWSMRGGCIIAVSYKDIERKGYSECIFGSNDKSWALDYDKNSCTFRFNSVKAEISGPRSSRIGVYLDHSAGALSFYSVSETMTLLHTVHTTFTQPLYAGVGFYHFFHRGLVMRNVTAHFPKLR